MANGTNGPDTFAVPAGTSDFHGFGGVDTLTFSFALVDATFTWVGNQLIIDTPSSHTVTTGFEVFQFTDGTVNNDDGSVLIDDLYYYSQNHDVWNAHVDADGHYNTAGWHENRNPNAFFDTKIYLTINPDVAAAGVNPLSHFHSSGWTEGRDPGLNFDVQKYLQANPDVAAAHIDPLAHFLAVGASEGRQPFPADPLPAANGFDYVYYIQNNPDVVAAGVDPFFHFQTTGWKEGRNPNAYFDVAGYLATNPDVAAAGINPLDHFHTTGWAEGRDPSPYFDVALYLLNNPDVAAANVDPLKHFLQFGIQEGRVAYDSALFDEDNAVNTILEGAANGTQVGLNASWGGFLSPNLTYSLIGDTSGGGFTINTATGVISVANGTLIDFENAPGNAYSVTVQASDDGNTITQVFVINVADAAPTPPTGADPIGSVNELTAPNGTFVGINLTITDPNGPAPTYTLTDDAGGRFTIDANGDIRVANGAAIDFEIPGHAYTVTAQGTVGAGSVTKTYTINVNNVNEEPQGADKTIGLQEDDASYTFTLADFGFSDPADDPANGLAAVIVSGGSPSAGHYEFDGTALSLPLNQTMSAADIALGKFKFIPAANTSGSGYTNFSFKVVDNGGTANGGVNTDQTANTITIDIAAVNDAPTAIGLTQSLTVNEDAAPTTLFALPPIISDVDSASVTATLRMASAAGTLLGAGIPVVDGADLVYTITNTPAQLGLILGGLNYDSADNFSGPASVAVTISDGANGPQGSNPTGIVMITVHPINDAPTATNLTQSLTVDEDAAPTLLFTVPPVVGDIDSAIVAAQLIIPAAAGTLGGAGPGTPSGPNLNYTISGTVAQVNAALALVTFTPATNFGGAASVTVAIEDGQFGPQGLPEPIGTVSITINHVNDAPTATNLTQSLTVGEDAAATNLFTVAPVIDDIDSADVTVTLTIATAAGSLGNAGVGVVNGLNTVYSITALPAAVNAVLATVTYTPAADFSGPASVAVAIGDGQNGPQGLPEPTGTISITVNPLNDAPTAQNITQSLAVAEDAAATTLFTVAPVVADVDSASVTATLTIASAAGTLGGAGTPVVNGADLVYTITGTAAEVNAALAAVTYDSADNFNGAVSVAVAVNDGLNGPQGANPTGTVSITVNPINDAPTATSLSQSLLIQEDATPTSLFTLAPTVADIDSANVTATLTVAETQGTLTGAGAGVLAAGVWTYSITDTPANVAAALAAVQFDSAPDFNGAASVSVAISDGANGPQGLPEPSGTVTVTVDPVNDEPRLFATGNNPSYVPGADLFSVTSLTPVEAGQLIDSMVLTVSGVTGADESLVIDGTPISLVNGTTPIPSGSVTVSVVAGLATVTLTSAPGLTGAALGAIIENLTYTKTTVAPGESPRVVTITELHDNGGTSPGDDTANPNLASTVNFNTPPDTNAASGNGNEDAASIAVALSGTDADGTVASFRITTLSANGTLFSDVGLTQQIALNGTVPAAGNAATVYFVPAANFNGPASFQYASIDDDGGEDQTPATASITVTAVNDAPTATNLTQSLTVAEDDAAPTTLFTLAPAVADIDSASVTATLTVTAAQGALNGAGAGVLALGVLTYTITGAPATVAAALAGVTFDSAPDFNGPASVGITIDDGLAGPQGTNPTGTVSITVNAVNDAPTATNLTQSLTINEDAAPTTLFTLAPTVADIDSASVTATLTVAAAQGALVGAGAGVLAAGILTYTIPGAPGAVAAALAAVTFDSAPDFNGPASVSVTIDDGANGPQGSNPTGTVSITINPLNDAPVVTAPGGVNTFIEGPGLTTGTPVFVDSAFTVSDVDNANLASATISITGGLQAGDVLSFTPGGAGITDTNGAADILALTGSATLAEWETVLRSITFATSHQDPTTSRTISIQVNDGSANSATITKNVTITPVNDEPTLAATADNGGAVTFIETSLPGDAGTGPIDLFDGAAASTVEASQAFTQLVVTVSNVADTTDFLMIGGTAVDLTNGNSEAVTGGTASVSVAGGTATVTINATTTFTAAQVQTLVDSLAYDNNDNTPTATTHTISVTSLTDNGANGGGNGDDNTGSPSLSTVVTVQPTNDAPVAADFTFNGSNAAIGNTALVVDDPSDGAPEPPGPQKTITGDLLAGGTDDDTPAALWTITAVGGGTTVTDANGSIVFQPDGDFTYLPAAGVTGNVIYNYQLNDNDALGSKSDVGQITINVAAPKVWYVSTTGSDTTGDGTSDNPFATLAPLSTGGSADTLDGAGDIIFMYGGAYTGGIVLEDGQQLISKEHGLTVNGTVLEAADGGSLTTINGTVTLANTPATANNIQGIDFGNTTGFSLTGTNVGNATVNTVTAGQINNTSGGAINIDGSGTGMNLQFTSVSTGGGTNAILFDDARGTFNANGGTLSNASGNTVSITGDNVNDDLNFTYGGSISDDGNLLVSIAGQSGGTKDFNGALTDGAGAGGGISILGNIASHLTRFDGGLNLSTGSANAFVTSSAGTLAITGSTNTIATTTGNALNVSGTTIHADDLTFQSISQNGGTNGIVLNGTGTSGGLTVTGNGVNGESTTGGLITNTSGVGVSLINTRDVSLTNLGISNTGSFGININSVTNFTYQDAAIINAGNENEENTIQILNLHGTSLIEDVRLDDIQEDGIQIRQDVDTDSNLNTFDTLTIRRLDLEDHQAGFGEAGIEIQTNLASTLAVVIDDSDFAINTNAIMGVAMSKSATFTGHQKVTIQNSTFDGSAAFGSGAIQALGSIGSGTTTYLITGNTITNTQFDGIRVNNDGGHTNVTITNNDIDGSTAVGKVNNGEGITLRQDENGSMTVLISGNDMTQITSNQIRIQGSDATIDDNVINVDATITNNTGTVAGSFGAGLLVDVGDGSGIAKNDVRINVTGNNLNGTNTTPFFDFDITLNLNETSGASLRVTQASDAALAAANISTTVSSFANPPNTITYSAGTPPLPPLPLLAAEGGVESASGTPGDHDLTSPELAVIVTAAIGRWGAAGLSGEQLARLTGIEFATADLGGSYLGVQDGGRILIDDDAAGYGWFVDTTPFDDAEFGHTVSATQLQADPSGAPAGHMDLLTLVMHEIGHALGLDHSHDASGGDLMAGALVTGERRLPDASDTAGISAPEIVGPTIVNGFDAQYYLAHNPDVAAAGIDPLFHFNVVGWHEGRNPNAFFDTEGYLAHYADVAAAGMNPLEHYAQWGWKEGRDPSAQFDTEAYLAANPDVAAANVNPLDHFLQFGIYEGRDALTDGLWRH